MSWWRIALVRWLLGGDSFVLMTKRRGERWLYQASMFGADDDTRQLRDEMCASTWRSIIKADEQRQSFGR